jgi:hypothetical protein
MLFKSVGCRSVHLCSKASPHISRLRLPIHTCCAIVEPLPCKLSCLTSLATRPLACGAGRTGNPLGGTPGCANLCIPCLPFHFTASTLMHPMLHRMVVVLAFPSSWLVTCPFAIASNIGRNYLVLRLLKLRADCLRLFSHPLSIMSHAVACSKVKLMA